MVGRLDEISILNCPLEIEFTFLGEPKLSFFACRDVASVSSWPRNLALDWNPFILTPRWASFRRGSSVAAPSHPGTALPSRSVPNTSLHFKLVAPQSFKKARFLQRQTGSRFLEEEELNH